ncbi:hypothetical protein [Oceanobacillus limi]|nr:hypothetical protein [Oceanobacillus limi]
MIISLFTFVLLSSCSSDEPVLVKKKTTLPHSQENPELIEQKNEDEEVNEFIEFTLDDEVVMLNLNLVPILNQYLHAVSDRNKKIEEMNIQRIHQKVTNSIYLLEFSCHNSLCSYLLFDQNKDNTGHLVADLANLIHAKLSPDHSKLLLQFNRESNLPLPVTHLVVLNLEEWQPVKLENEHTDTQLLHYKWPILGLDWVNNETISVVIPDIIEPTPEMINNWQNELEITTTILLKTQLE